jgi:AcrR family transcriptional regulator
VSTTRRYDSTARQGEARARRAAIVEAAARLFLDEGYAETTIAQVAREAGVSPQLVYASFDGKAGLLAGVIDLMGAGDDQQVLIRDRPEWVALQEIRDPADRLREFGRMVAEVNARVGPLQVLLDRAGVGETAVGELRERMLAAMREDYQVNVNRWGAGLRPDLGPERVAEVIRVVTGHQVWHGLVVDGGWTHEQYTDWVCDALIRLVVLDPGNNQPPT